MIKRLSALAALVLLAGLSVPASARDAYVADQAGMFSSGTVSALNSRIASFNAQTHKEVVVQTVPSLGGVTIKDAGEKAFAQQAVDGVLIFIAKDDRRDIIIPDTAGVKAGWFTPDTLRAIRESMESNFKNGDYDTGITTAVSGVLGIYRSHVSSMPGAAGSVPAGATTAYSNSSSTGGFHLSGIWLIVILVAAFLVLRSLIRAMTAPRPMYPPGAVPPGAPGAPGYGPGYGGGYGGGGGSFFSGLLGGLGGAFLGNELFGNRGGGNAGGWGGSDVSGGGGAAPDAGGWGSDAGQADMGGSSGGDWSGGGFGDSGGGGDFGGGGGDSGGGW